MTAGKEPGTIEIVREKGMQDVTIRSMTAADKDRVMAIYKQGIDRGDATFRIDCPSWEEWDSEHRKDCRYVAESDGRVVGFTAVSPVSQRPWYRGVAEVTVYVDEACQSRGVGTALLTRLMEEAPKKGIWTLFSSIYSFNEKSLRLHEKCGFRTIGYRERLARDRFGNWADTVHMEYRFPDHLVVEK